MAEDTNILAALRDVKAELAQLKRILLVDSDTKNRLWIAGEGKMFEILAKLLERLDERV